MEIFVFSEGEIRLGLRYELHCFLVEVDGEIDQFMLNVNGFLGNFPSIGYMIGERRSYYVPRIDKSGDEDEAVAYRAGVILRPPASGELSFSERLHIHGNKESGREEYQAFAWVVPEVCNGFRRTNMVSINLD